MATPTSTAKGDLPAWQVVVLLLAVTTFLGIYFKDTLFPPKTPRPRPVEEVQVEPASSAPASAQAAASVTAPAAPQRAPTVANDAKLPSSVKKCEVQGQTVYTDMPCPAEAAASR